MYNIYTESLCVAFITHYTKYIKELLWTSLTFFSKYKN